MTASQTKTKRLYRLYIPQMSSWKETRKTVKVLPRDCNEYDNYLYGYLDNRGWLWKIEVQIKVNWKD